MTSYKDARALVLGASGFIGRWVAHELHASGCEVHVLARDAEHTNMVARTIGFRGRVTECDLRDLDRVAASIQQLRPDIIFNLAGYGVGHAERDPALAERINSDLVATIAQAVTFAPRAGWRGQRIVHVGSAAEYGTNEGDLAEDSIEQPVTLYGQTKLRGTRALTGICRAHHIPGITARLFTVYGPWERPERLLPTLVRAANGHEPIPLTHGFQRRDFIYVKEAAEALLRLGVTQAPRGAIVNVVSGRLQSVREFVETAALVLGIADDRLRFGELPEREHEMWHAPVSNTLLRALTGWSPRITISDGISRTYAYSAAQYAVSA